MWGKNFMLVWGLASFWLSVGTHAFQTLPLIRNYDFSLSNFPANQNTLSRARGKMSTSSVFLALESQQDEQSASQATLRDKLRKVTGFSLTAFRAAWRTATGISLTAVYATALAASGLWIRKITSVILAVFPAWPFLIAYYLPIFVIRGLTGPTRKQAKARHEAVKESLRDAIEFAKRTKSDGYWPVEVNEDGDFELVSPPQPDQNERENLADAVAESVEQAMEQGYKPEKQSK